MAEDYKLIDNEEKHRYEFQIDGKIAEIDYIKSNNGYKSSVTGRSKSFSR